MRSGSRIARSIGFTVTGLLVLLAAAALSLEAKTGADSPYTKKADVGIVMSDGAKLATDIYLPRREGRHPVVLIRTPYKKENMGSLIAEFFAANGYAAVVQDTRGRFGSEGDFLPFIHERKDGLETLDWISEQDWSGDGIGVWGPSYLGYCGLILAISRHPALKTVINISGVGDIDPVIFPGGAFHLMAALPWALFMEGVDLRTVDLSELYRHVPLLKAPSSIETESRIMDMFADTEIRERFGSELSIRDQLENIGIPILHMTGLNDWIYRSTLEVYSAIRESQVSGEKVAFQKLIIGPWYHDQQWEGGTRVGDEDFGPLAKMDVQQIRTLSLRWMDHWLKGKDDGLLEEPAVDLFIMGKNAWSRERSWPPHDVVYRNWYLRSEKGAASLAGDGKLSLEKNIGPGRDRFVFDPLDPVPTLGGVNFHFFPGQLGVRDQRPVEKRKDVLVYTSEPLADDLEIIGPIKAVLYVSTEGRDTDFTAKLVEVRPDGYARIIEDGIIRARYRHSRDNPEFLEPGQVYELTVDLGATAVLIRKGCRIRLEISSSNFPKYDRNPNTGEEPLQAVEFKKVTQTIHHSDRHPSRLVLPVRISGG